MKKVLLICVVICIALLGACSFSIDGPTKQPEYNYEYNTTAAEGVVGTGQETTIPVQVTLPSSPAETEAAETGTVSDGTTVTESEAETETTKPSSQPENTTASSVVIPEVDLSISMPEKNGTMVTDSSTSNKFIQIVHKNRKISTDMLIAVFSVPESGQNYVFEYKTAESREADNIRRVYLIDSSGKITGVAAADSSEKENVTSVENWFCMNVLIKEIIYPAIEDDIK